MRGYSSGGAFVHPDSRHHPARQRRRSMIVAASIAW
jgi:hypothetical protein